MNLTEYWDAHDKKYKPDFKIDPLGLQNVCIPEAPLWLNKYHDTLQKRVFYKLLDNLNSTHDNFLELGCGTGRWSKRLYERGWRGIAIDLQESLIDSNKRRIPAIVFIHGDFINFNLPGTFDLVFSVTVLQHIPQREISDALWWIREHLSYGDRFIMLENISFKSETMFSHSIAEWEGIFRMHHLRLLKVIPYDHSFFIKISSRMGGILNKQAVWLDSLLDPLWRLLRIRWGANHAGFLFTKY